MNNPFKIFQVIRDLKENIEQINWTLYGRVKEQHVWHGSPPGLVDKMESLHKSVNDISSRLSFQESRQPIHAEINKPKQIKVELTECESEDLNRLIRNGMTLELNGSVAQKTGEALLEKLNMGGGNSNGCNEQPKKPGRSNIWELSPKQVSQLIWWLKHFPKGQSLMVDFSSVDRLFDEIYLTRKRYGQNQSTKQKGGNHA